MKTTGQEDRFKNTYMRINSLFLILFMLAALLSNSCKESGSTKLNLNFESINKHSKIPIGWDYFEYGCQVNLDRNIVFQGKYSLRVEANRDRKFNKGYGGAVFRFDSIQSNQTIRLTGLIKNESTDNDSIGLYIGCNGPNGDIRNVTKSQNFIGSHDWQEYSVELKITGQPDYFRFGVIMTGNGKIWVDNLSLFINSKEIKNLPELYTYKVTSDEIKWLKDNCVTIKTVKPENGFKDLEPLKVVFKNSRIVALGENSHGTREVFEMKHRLVEFLSSEMGFNIFAIESEMIENDPVNNYILTGQGDPQKLLTALTPAWNTQEVLTMIQWMQRFNSRTKTNFQFYGFDLQAKDYRINSKSNYRDSCMAKNVERILDDHPDSKIVLWAHNEHITKNNLAMGEYLVKRYGKEYYSVGFSTNKGKYTAGNRNRITTDNVLTKSIPGSIDYNFYQTGLQCFFLDLNMASNNEPNCSWLNKKLYLRTIGADATENQFLPASLKEKFDGIVFINKTSPTRTFVQSNKNQKNNGL